MTQTFGVKVWPPPELLPGAVRDRLTAFGEARDRVAKLHAQLGNVRRVELPQAKMEDLEAAANAVEESKPLPKVNREQKMAQKIAGLEHEIQVAELVQQRCLARLNAAVEEHAAQISHEAERRMGEARKAYLSAIDQLEAAAERWPRQSRSRIGAPSRRARLSSAACATCRSSGIRTRDRTSAWCSTACAGCWSPDGDQRYLRHSRRLSPSPSPSLVC